MGRSGGVSSGAWFEMGTGANDRFFISRNGYSSTGTTQFFINSNNNVGIGTTSPSYKLDVNGTARFQGNIIASNGQYIGSTPVAIKIPYSSLAIIGSAVSDSQASDGTAAVRYSSSPSNTFFYGPYAALDAGSYVARFRIKFANNSSSSYIGYIDVVGTNIIGNAIELRPNMLPSGGDYYYIDIPFTCSNDSSSYELRWIDWQTGVTDTYLDHVLIVSQSQTNNIYVTNGDSFNIYESQLKRFTILNGSGNVGIGTGSPSGKLHVVDADGQFTTYDANGYSRFTAVDGSAQIGLFRSGANAGGVYIGGDGASFNVYKSDFSSTLLTILQSSGNVGIGTTTPAEKLDITNGKLRFTNTGSNRFSTIGMDDNFNFYIKNTNQGNLYLGNGTTTYINGSFIAGSNSVVIETGGNVGIGTTSPSHPLSVQANSGANAIAIYGRSSDNTGSLDFFQNNGTTRLMEIGISPSAAEFYYDANSPMIFYTNATERMRITSGGNVGIGTTSPGKKLVVTGASNDEWIATFTNTGTTPYGIYVDTSANSSTGYSFAAYTNVGTGFFVRNNGNVGIGTTTPGYPLSVNGSIYADAAIRVGGSNPFYFENYGGGWFMQDSTWIRTYSEKSIWAGNGLIGCEGGLTIGYSGTTPPSTGAIINGRVGVGTTAPDTSAVMDLSSRRQGFLPPRMTNSEMNSIGSPATGLIVYDTTNNKVTVYNGSSWVPLH
jgi:hypothetical protein